MNEPEANRNPLFELLVGDSNDIEGLAAYALYKRHKRQWAHNFRTRLGREPTSDEEKNFAQGAATADQLERYRKDAQDILIEFATGFVEDERPQIAVEAVTGRVEAAARKVEQASSLRSLVIVGVVSTLITSAFLALLAFGTRVFGIDLVDAIVIEQPSLTTD